MAYTSKMVSLCVALMAAHVALAVPMAHHGHHHKHRAVHKRDASSCPVQQRDSCDFGIPDPADWPATYSSQWCGMINNEVAGLNSGENPTVMLPNLEAIYAQANIKASCDSALPNIDQLMQDPQARAAMTQMKANYPAFGSMDLTPEDIQTVYAPAISAATAKAGVPEDVMVKIIWTESKGHPLVYGALTQMDYVAWGQMADLNPDLQNRYMPTDNIVASAMYLANAQAQYGCDWDTCYQQYYQG